MTPPAKLVLGDYVMQPGTDESGVYFKTSQMFSIAKSTRHPKEAAILLNFLVSDPQSVEALGLERGIPLNKAAETLLTEKGVIDPNDPVVAGLRQAQSLHTTAVATPYIEDLQVIDQFTSAREKLDLGKQTTAEVVPCRPGKRCATRQRRQNIIQPTNGATSTITTPDSIITRLATTPSCGPSS